MSELRNRLQSRTNRKRRAQLNLAARIHLPVLNCDRLLEPSFPQLPREVAEEMRMQRGTKVRTAATQGAHLQACTTSPTGPWM